MLAVMIVIRHNSSFANYADPSGSAFHRFLVRTVTEIAVPMFFFFSGMNFFRNYEPRKTGEKLRRRVKSLLIPYLVWNTIFCVFAFVTSNTPISKYFIGRERYLFTIPNLIAGCLYHWNCNLHFWFLFDLILFALMSPLFYYSVKDKWIGLITITGCYVAIFMFGLRLPQIIFYRTDALLYYIIGAYFVLHSKEFRAVAYEKREGFKKYCYVLSGLVLIGLTLLMACGSFPIALKPFVILLGGYGLWLISTAVQIDTIRVPSRGTTFFIYPAHGIIQPVLVKLFFIVLPKVSCMSWLNFVLSVTGSILLICGIRCFLRNHLPAVDRVLTGWRT